MKNELLEDLEIIMLKVENMREAHPRNRLVSPIEIADITRVFDNFGDLRNTSKGWYAHGGIDISAPEGIEISVPADSIVTNIRFSKVGWGNRIYFKISNGSFQEYVFAFCHCCWIKDLKRWDEIKAGEIVAQVGQSGNSTGPHLHLMIGTNLAWNGYATRTDETSTIGFCDPAGIFDFTGVRWG